MSGASNCDINHHYKGLSIFTTVCCCLLFLSTTFLNSLIIHIVLKNRANKFKIFFYKLLLNVSIADALIGYIADAVFIGIHIKESLEIKTTKAELITAHMIMFNLGGVSLITLMYLCIDRIYAILRPYAYRNGISVNAARCAIASTWCVSTLQACVYLFTGFMKYLVVFTTFNIIVPFCLLALTVLVYHNKFMRHPQQEDAQQEGTERAKLNQRNSESKKKGKRATIAFLKMLLVFILSYLPACFITVYFNVCMACDCMLIHILRDLSVLFILSGSLLRAINYLVTLTSLRREVAKLFGRNPENSSSDSAGVTQNY